MRCGVSLCLLLELPPSVSYLSRIGCLKSCSLKTASSSKDSVSAHIHNVTTFAGVGANRHGKTRVRVSQNTLLKATLKQKVHAWHRDMCHFETSRDAHRSMSPESRPALSCGHSSLTPTSAKIGNRQGLPGTQIQSELVKHP